MYYIVFSEFNKQAKNASSIIKHNSFRRIEDKIHLVHHRNVFSQYLTFLGGACLVVIYYYRNDHFKLLTRIKLSTLCEHQFKKHLLKLKISNNTAKSISVAILKTINTFKGIIKQFRICILPKYKCQITPKPNFNNVNIFLLNKLREYSEERRNLGSILLTAIQENKNLRMRYELEMLAKKRLVKRIENTQKLIQENRYRYNSYQQLYLLTYQENNFLKSRVKKLAQDKDNAERNLLKLVNHVWQSKNNDLKAFCSRFIVQTNKSLLNYDARVEVDKFITKSTKPKLRFSEPESNKLHSLDTITEVNENFQGDKDMITLVKNDPKSNRLPGECVWTVKDKNGYIEKLYEYETDFDNGDTIRRIRQYSVYYEKDCLLDVPR